MRALLAMLTLVALPLAAADDPTLETLTVSCAISVCSDTEPSTLFDDTPCAEYDLNNALIVSAMAGDRSAVAMLEQRYPTTFTYREQHRIAAALLGRASNDRKYWNDLSTRAEEAVRFAYVDQEPTKEFVEWCAARDVHPEDYRWLMIDALTVAGADRRARPLLEKALASLDFEIVGAAVPGIAEQRDETLLPSIEENLKRFPDLAVGVVWSLLAFQSDDADELALKLLPAEEHEEYREQRRQFDASVVRP